MSGAATCTCSAPHREALELLFSTGQDLVAEKHYKELDDVVREGCLACLRFARENRIMDQYWASWQGACTAAAEYGHWECLKYLHEICGCPLSASATEYAVGNLEMLKYLRERGCNYDEDTVSAAIRCGDLESLEYLLDVWCVDGVCEDRITRDGVEEIIYTYAPEMCDFNQFKCLQYIDLNHPEATPYGMFDFMSELERRWSIEPIKLAMKTLDEVKECMTDGSWLMHAYRKIIRERSRE